MLSREHRALAAASLAELATRHAVKVRPAKDWRTATSYRKTRQVWVPPLRTGSDYLVALHELGHIIDADSRRYARRLTRTAAGHPSSHAEIMQEAGAWSWAVQNADLTVLRALTAADWARVGDCWTTYLAC